MYLIDTSTWILHFSRNDPFHLSGLVQSEEIVLSPPIYQEILQGIGAEAAYRTTKELLEACSFCDNPIPLQRYEEAAELYRIGRKTGITVRSGTDCLIAATAIEHGLIVLHRDRDYPNIAQFSGLQQLRI